MRFCLVNEIVGKIVIYGNTVIDGTLILAAVLLVVCSKMRRYQESIWPVDGRKGDIVEPTAQVTGIGYRACRHIHLKVTNNTYFISDVFLTPHATALESRQDGRAQSCQFVDASCI